MVTVIEKENALLAGQVVQTQLLNQIAATVAGLSANDNTALLAAVQAADAHIGKLETLIGADVPEPAPAPAPEPSPAAA